MKYLLLPLLVWVAAACSAESDTPDPASQSDATTDASGSAPSDATTLDVAESAPDATDPGEVADVPTPADIPPQPEGPTPAQPGAYSGGECPVLQPGVNTFESAGHQRTVQVYFPEPPVEQPAVLFVWHALGANASLFANIYQAQSTANERGAIVVVPESCCNPQAEWDVAADSGLFDDLLRCLLDQHHADGHRVYTSGFSAGGLWSTWLQMHRAEMLAASVIFSGGVTAWLPYASPTAPANTVAVDGGPGDTYGGVVYFHTMTKDLVDKLVADDHAPIHCVHSGGHVIPFGADQWAYPFLFSHRYGQPSPYADGPDATFPDWCSAPR